MSSPIVTSIIPLKSCAVTEVKWCYGVYSGGSTSTSEMVQILSFSSFYGQGRTRTLQSTDEF